MVDADVTFDEWRAGKTSHTPTIEPTPEPAPAPQPVPEPAPGVVGNSLGAESEYTSMNLTDDQMNALRGYYQGDAYDINSRLREGNADGWTVEQMDAAFDQNKAKKDMTVYRKVNSGQLQALTNEWMAEHPELRFPDLHEGGQYTDKGYSSTSKSTSQPRYQLNSGEFEGDTELVIKVPKGAKAIDLQPIADRGLTEGMASEQEILLPRNAKFKVVSIEDKELDWGANVGRNYKTGSPIEIERVKRVTLELISGEQAPMEDYVFNARNWNQSFNTADNSKLVIETTRRLQQAPEVAQKLFARYSSKFDYMGETNGNSAYFPDKNAVRLNMKSVIGDERRHDYDTFFHEFAHGIDYNSRVGGVTSDGALADKVKEDAVAIFQKGPDFVASVNHELQTLPEQQIGDVSDILDGVTRRVITGGAGHPVAYWDEQGVRLSAETFADITSAYINNPESLALIKKYLPKTFAHYKKMIKELTD
jgi:hypothetical protein